MTKQKFFDKYYKPVKDIIIKLLIFYEMYEQPIEIALSNISDEDWIRLKIFYNCKSYDKLIQEIENDLNNLIH